MGFCLTTSVLVGRRKQGSESTREQTRTRDVLGRPRVPPVGQRGASSRSRSWGNVGRCCSLFPRWNGNIHFFNRYNGSFFFFSLKPLPNIQESRKSHTAAPGPYDGAAQDPIIPTRGQMVPVSLQQNAVIPMAPAASVTGEGIAGVTRSLVSLLQGHHSQKLL